MRRAVTTRNSRTMVITTRTSRLASRGVHSEFVSSAKQQHELDATAVTTTVVITTTAATTTAVITTTATTTTATGKRLDRRCSRATRPAIAKVSELARTAAEAIVRIAAVMVRTAGISSISSRDSNAAI